MENPYPHLKGLTSEEVAQRVSQGLVNRTAAKSVRTLREILAENVFSLFNGIILAIMLFVLFFFWKTGDMRLLLDSIGIFLVAFGNTVIAVFQELRAKAALDKVNLLLKREVQVIRDGELVSLPPEQLVVDDLVVLLRGDQAVVDGEVVESNHLEMDESLLTGESVPIDKDEGAPILSGSFATAGSGVMRADKVGEKSFAASVTGMARKYKFALTPLQQRINVFIKLLFVVALVLVSLQVAAEFIRQAGTPEADFVRKIATILSSMVPQGLVLFSSVTFALGIFRISRIGALIQKLNAIENFSSIRVVCTDKTGTLTENRLKLEKLTPLGGAGNLEGLLGTYAQLSVEKNATLRVLEALAPLPGATALDEIPFSSRTKYGVLKLAVQGQEGIYLLGAWDILIHQVRKEDAAGVQKTFGSPELENFRNLLFARVQGGVDWEALKQDSTKITLEPLAAVSLSDTVRTDVYEALELFSKNDIQVKVLSGDAPQSVKAVLQAIGWKLQDHQMITGSELDALDEAGFQKAAAEKLVFARLKPEHKLNLLKALKSQGIRTAMIGDGVNDLPAVKEAHIGIAMEEGSSITKEVADIVLLKNRFALLPRIFDEGNKIIQTVAAVAKLFLTKNFMVIIMSLFSIFFLWEFPLTPRRVTFLNWFGIAIPALLLALENRNTSPMKKFLAEVFSYVFISASVAVGAQYLSLYLVSGLGASQSQVQMAMVFTLVFIFQVNFLVIALQARGRPGLYAVFALGLLGFLVLFSTWDSSFFLFDWLKKFFEIETIQLNLWPSIILSCGLSAGVLVGLQILRKKVIRG